MKRILLSGIAALLALSTMSGAMAQDKKTLAFVVNGASDFWKNAEAGREEGPGRSCPITPSS